MEGKSAALSDAEKRVIEIKTEAGDPVIYSGNPAELSGARFEMRKAMRRAGAFKLLVSMNASRLPNGTICVEDLDMVPLVTNLIADPHADEYSFERPCPSTPARIARMNATRALAGQAPYTGVPNLNSIPDKILKMATPNPYEVETEALAYALTQLSIFTDRIHANELLVQCEYDGRRLSPLLDAIEATARAEDVTLVTGRRNAFKEAGLKGEPLSFDAFRKFFKDFNTLEYKCPADKRLTDEDLSQLVGTLFIKDPSYRKSWTDHVNQPTIRNALGVAVSGPPQTFAEAKALAEKILRSSSVMAGIDELSTPSGIVLSADHVAALRAAHIDAAHLPSGEALRVAQALLAAAAHDPRRTFNTQSSSQSQSTTDSTAIDVPKGPDGKYLYWAPPMKLCECGTPDEGRHIRYKWPCAWYRKDDGTKTEGGRGSGKAGSKGGKQSSKGGRGKGAKGQLANFTAEQISAAVAALESANPSPAPSTAGPSERAESEASVKTSTTTKTQSSCVAEYGNTAELNELLNSTTLRNDLASFFASIVESDTSVVEDDEVLATIKHKAPIFLQTVAEPNVDHRSGVEARLNDRDEPASAAVADRTIAGPVREAGPENCNPPLETSVSRQLSSAVPCCAKDRLHDLALEATGINPATLIALRDLALAARAFDSVAPCSTGSCQAPLGPLKSSSDRQPEHFACMANPIGCNGGESPKCKPGDLPAKPPKPSDLPIFRAGVDSCCTATCTASLDMLVNVRACNESFKVADGKTSMCEAIGDMPVLARTAAGKIFRFLLKNVRYVPDFEYTLISVNQIWDEQSINSVFAESKELRFPDGSVIPFDPRFRLPAVTLISEPILLRVLESRGNAGKRQSASQECHVGFHNVKSTAHIARLPAAQASELLHRRCHMGVNKIRALPHVTSDAPKILASAILGTCVHCATSQIRRAGHSGTLDTPAAEPGELHLDLKGPFPPSVIGKYRYAAFFIDEHSRFVFIVFLHDKSEVIEATKLAMAKFNASVGVPVNESGVPLARPSVRRLHRDHEGGLESRQFEAFRANKQLHSTTSAPHDHDLNPIAESIINVISTLATSFKSQAGVPIGFWPELFRHAVEWHNSVPQASLGSSTASPEISPAQRFTLKQPKVMDLPAFGVRAVVLKPPQHQSKTTLSSRGWVGMFLGRSADSLGTYEVWVPEIRRKVKSSSVAIDEEFFPWLGADAHQPLTSAMSTSRFLSDHVGSIGGVDNDSSPAEFASSRDVNEVPRPTLSFFNMFSGPYNREDGLSKVMETFGWSQVTNLDNDKVLGGGWADDLMNDAKYIEILQKAKAGAWDAIMAQYPCKTTCIAPHFDASQGHGDRGPRPLRNAAFPDGKPRDQLTEAEFKRLQRANRLADRMVEVLIAARQSPRKTTIVLENPSDRDQPGTQQHMSDLEEGHGSWWKMSQFRRLCEAIPDFSMCTFANCRFGADEQKYFTLWYTKEAAPVLDKLNDPEHQCNHEPGTHKAIAGGRNPDGSWRSTATARYKFGMIVKVAMAFTFARTGDPTPLGLRSKPAKDPFEKPAEAQPSAQASQPDGGPEPDLAETCEEPRRRADDVVPDGDRQNPSGTPRRLSFPPSPSTRGVPTAPAPITRSVSRSPESRGVPSLGTLHPPEGSPTSPSTNVNLGGGIASSPRLLPRQGAGDRAVRASTRAATLRSHELQQLLDSKRRVTVLRGAIEMYKDSLPHARRTQPGAVPL